MKSFVKNFFGMPSYLSTHVGPHHRNGYNSPLREDDCLRSAFVLMFLLSAICFQHYACFVFFHIAIMADGR
jgi:hypothetical protein